MLLASCTSMKKSTSAATVGEKTEKKTRNPKFLDNIRINPAAHTAVAKADKKTEKNTASGTSSISVIESCNVLQFKYSILINTPVELLSNYKLLQFIDEWYGTPYRFGGSTKTGVDCSAFTSFLLTNVYGVTIPRTSKEQFDVSQRIDKNELQEGDLVFFNSKGRINHVGVYVGNNKFAHASTSSGVMISDLDEAYFSKRYAGSGRVR